MSDNPTHAFDWDGGDDAFPAHDAPLVADRRTESRIAVVQLLAMALLMSQNVAEGRAVLEAKKNKRNFDKKLFALLADDLTTGQDRYTEMVQSHFHTNWPWARTNVVLRAVLMVAATELTAQPTLPTGVVVEEYMNISKGFLPEEEVAFVRVTLEKLVAQIRP